MPQELTIELEPRSSCSFSISAFSAELIVNHEYPLIVMHDADGEVVDLFNVSSRIANGTNCQEWDEAEGVCTDEIDSDCYSSGCNRTY